VRRIKNVSYDYTGQVVLITGGARGQGRAHALAFARAGADIAICDIAEDVASIGYSMASREDLEETTRQVEALDARCLAFVCDIRDEQRVQEVVAQVLDEFGRIDVLINNAGANSVVELDAMSSQAWHAVVDTMLDGTRNCARAVAPSMIEQGRGKIVNTGSVESFLAFPGNSHYVTAKHGLLGLTRALAVELGPHGINANMVCPGAVYTPLSDGMRAAAPEWPDAIARLTGSWNVFDGKSALEADDISQAILWLASDAADPVTGIALPVDCGLMLT